ncbi:MAG TPA: cell division protein FtsZ [Candidatus Sulfomarinibacteraceae bacterium]|nr:cell division protein FtsZ [Candidatus Sulfomarinibacteraceae bacterium]
MLRRKRFQHLAHISVVGLGSGGITAVNHMIDSGVTGIEFLAVDTDEKALRRSLAPVNIFIPPADRRLTAATGRETPHSLLGEALAGSDMVFLIGGLGGRTATDLAPATAAIAREHEALTTAIVTFPFSFEGEGRARLAREAIRRLKKHLHTLIVVPNDRLLEMAGGQLAFHETYRLAHNIWHASIQGISELVNAPGLVNVDFADVRAIMSGGGASIIATGKGRGQDRAQQAAREATHSPYLDVTIDGARGILFNISGGLDMSLHEVKQAAAVIRKRADADANIIFGATIDGTLRDEIRITVIATGCGLALPERRSSQRQADEQLQRTWMEPSTLSYA